MRARRSGREFRRGIAQEMRRIGLAAQPWMLHRQPRRSGRRTCWPRRAVEPGGSRSLGLAHDVSLRGACKSLGGGVGERYPYPHADAARPRRSGRYGAARCDAARTEAVTGRAWLHPGEAERRGRLATGHARSLRTQRLPERSTAHGATAGRLPQVAGADRALERGRHLSGRWRCAGDARSDRARSELSEGRDRNGRSECAEGKVHDHAHPRLEAQLTFALHAAEQSAHNLLGKHNVGSPTA